MIDWLSLVFNSIWIIALALALAMFSIAYYQGRIEEKKISILLKTRKYSITLNIAGATFCLGMALTADRWWEIGLWIVLIGLFSYQAWIANKVES